MLVAEVVFHSVVLFPSLEWSPC